VRGTVVPPARVPPALYKEFSVGGTTPIELRYFNEAVDSSIAPIVVTWGKEKLANLAVMARERKENYYGSLDTDIYALLDRHPIRGKTVVVMGSLEPWYEVRNARSLVRAPPHGSLRPPSSRTEFLQPVPTPSHAPASAAGHCA